MERIKIQKFTIGSGKNQLEINVKICNSLFTGGKLGIAFCCNIIINQP